ncbi:MAG: hypothetical protein OEV97_17435, partial [Betaproteobacteria bacterium]|nr:hypothetical protein [Betaproteobacteria bacterium]
LSASGGGGVGGVRAVSESQVCAFCHTPHAATPGVTPLWNRKLSDATYTVYTSSSLDANAIQGSLDQPGGSSKLCLSCHDGTLAIGNVNVLNGLGSGVEQGTVTIPMTGTGTGGVMPPGQGVATGYTRNVGVDLTNDHPISLTYTSALAARDGELRAVDPAQRWPAGSGTIIGVRAPGYRPLLPLEPTAAGGQGQVQCGSCHDPHIRETDAAQGNQKFLRQNRFQVGTPGPGYSEAGDIMCLSCHDKNGISGTWAFSAHANPQVATQTYLPSVSTAPLRDFPANLPVWRASCLNCHDTHTVQGARRLTREGTDSPSSPKSGGASAIEEVCYQCHSATPVITNTGAFVPNIRSEYARAVRMPITNAEQGVTTEAHDIGGNFADLAYVNCTTSDNRCGADFVEPRARLGVGNLANRHAECTDCHNPHRVVKFRSFIGAGGNISGAPDAAGTHAHVDGAGSIHSNIASGVLRGTTGVEPIYGSASFHSLPTSYAFKRGDPGASADTSVAASYVTREYQICLKCHSDFGYDDNNVLPVGSRPSLGRTGGTASGTNNLTQYTNQAKEFQAPLGHRGEVTTVDSGAFAGDPPGPVASVNFQTSNHRSWHPVTGDTGRTPAVRGGLSANNWQFPWRNAVGTQTMYCSDCHGAEVAASNSVIPDGGENGVPWGPHGSNNSFLLKGAWNTATGTGQQAAGLCFKCHSYTIYATRADTRTGFWLTDRGEDGHSMHADRIGRLRCNWCHVAVPHGWKNKAFLVNLNDVGQEAGQVPGTQVRNNTTAAYNQQPYYLNAVLKIRNFRPSGQWRATDCGSVGAPGNGQSGRDWMRDS